MSRFNNVLDAFEEADYLVDTTGQPHAIVRVDDEWVEVLPYREAQDSGRRILEVVCGRS